MIIVVADDFTGAAEMAGICLDFGLSTEIQTDFSHDSDKDVIIIDTNTRSKPEQEAAKTVKEFMLKLEGLPIDLLFKKTDSVLRGNVYSELSVLQEMYPPKSILLVPSNPSMGRTIHKGIYYVNGKIIENSVFSHDPECPAKDSNVLSLLKQNKGANIQLLGIMEAVPSTKEMVYIADAVSIEDMEFWARQYRQDIIPAGAADYFKALLLNRGFKRKSGKKYDYDFKNRRSLIVCGSSLSNAENICEEVKYLNPHVIEVYGEQICSNNNSHQLVEITRDVIDSYAETNMVIVLVKIDENRFDHATIRLPHCLASIVRKVLKSISIDELFVEGGSTSSEIVRKVGWNRFEPISTSGNGIVRMRIIGSDCNVTVKPGSYEWPPSLWRNESANNKLIKEILIQGE